MWEIIKKKWGTQYTYLFKPELIAVEDIHIELNKGNENINSNEGYLNQ